SVSYSASTASTASSSVLPPSRVFSTRVAVVLSCQYSPVSWSSRTAPKSVSVMDTFFRMRMGASCRSPVARPAGLPVRSRRASSDDPQPDQHRCFVRPLHLGLHFRGDSAGSGLCCASCSRVTAHGAPNGRRLQLLLSGMSVVAGSGGRAGERGSGGDVFTIARRIRKFFSNNGISRENLHHMAICG